MTTEQMFQLQLAADYALITFRGQMDAATVQKIKPVLLAQLPVDISNIIVDLAKVEFLDSHGVGLFVSLLKRAHMHRGRLALAGAHGQPQSVLLMVGFNGELVTYCRDTREAKELFIEEGSRKNSDGQKTEN